MTESEEEEPKDPPDKQKKVVICPDSGCDLAEQEQRKLDSESGRHEVVYEV